MIETLDDTLPARDLVKKRHKYFIGVLDPCASIEFSRGCPWDCSFCSAWTFYGRSYRKVSAERGRRGPGADPRARRVHRRRRGLHPCRARLRHRRRDREARHPQAVLPGDPRRRAAQEQGGLRALEEARPQLHVPRRRGDRRGGAQAPPQAGQPGQELRGAGVCPLARHHRGDQHHRRPELGRGAASPWSASGCCRCPRSCTSPSTPPTPAPRPGPTDAREPRHPRLPAVRRPARRAAHQAAAGEILRGAGQDPADPQQEAPGLAGAPAAAPRSPRAISCAARPTS